ncbi:Tetratricopeptide repeat-containing protein [Cladophialophora immunda]|nr:Tetratricopeptide repeat-containing protein [Cladophialophora immunda]
MSWPTAVAGGWTSVILLATLLLYYQLTRGIPSRQRPEQAPRSKFGVVPVDGSRQGLGTQLRRDGVDIIFVHGLGSNPDSTWLARSPRNATGPRQRAGVDGDGVCWVTDLLIADIPPAVRRKTRIFFYNHDSYWQRGAVQTRLWNLAGNLLQHLQGKIRQTEEEKARDLVFVAYSYGGLLVKQALIRAKNAALSQDIVNRTRGIVFLGTPHRGSNFTLLGSWIAWSLRPLGSNQTLLDEITYDSIYNFFEERPTYLVDIRLFQLSKFCVKEQSATYSDSAQHVYSVGLNVDHSGLNKFGARTAAYELVRDALMQLLPPPLQKIYSVPRGRVQTYTARQDLSQSIYEALGVTFDDGAAEVDGTVRDFQAVVIHGMGGVGKTQLALNYAEETRECYNPVFWIDAQTKETVQISFERGAAALGLTFRNPPTADIELQAFPAVAGVCCWFSERDEGDPRWLVIVDNADDTSWRIDEIIPRGVRGHVIVTSQHRQTPNFLGGSCKLVEARELSREEARTLLKAHVRLTVGSGWEQELEGMDDLCDLVVGRLGCLALATELAGLYLSDQLSHFLNDTNVMKSEAFRRVFRQYLDDFERHQDELLQGKPFQRLSSYQKTVWTVWDTSLAAIEKQFPQSHTNQMLTFLAQFDRGQVEKEMFRLASDGWSDMIDQCELSEDGIPEWLQCMVIRHNIGWDDFHYRQATQPLMRYGLLRQVDGEWSATTMHNLVQWRARKAGEEMKVVWRRCTLFFLLAAVCRINRDKERSLFRRHLIAHLLEMNIDYGDLVQELQLKEIPLASLAQELLGVFSSEGRWQKAEELALQVLKVRKKVLGARHHHTLQSMDNLGRALLNSGKYQEAEKSYREILELRIRARGKKNVETLQSMGALAFTLNQLGKIEETEETQREALEMTGELVGKEDPFMLKMLSDLSIMLLGLEKCEEAEKILRDVLQVRQRRLGKEHPETLETMNNLGCALRGLQQLDEAKSMCQEAVQGFEKMLGKEHPRTLTSMDNFAAVLYALQDLEEAKTIFQEVFQRGEKVLGKEHPDTLINMSNLALALGKLNQYEETWKLCREAVPLMEKVLGKEHPDTLASMHNLAWALNKLGQHEEALKLCHDAVPLMAKVLGKEHPCTLHCGRLLETLSKRRDGP